jgi:LuxR family maltose regulon positive regulatory protein
MALRDRVDMTAAPGEISGDDAYITDYFRDELLARQTPETAQFLLRTAVLGQFSASLCDAVLRTTGSAVRLAEIERQNLFLVPLDHHREWYRYHRLFAEALVAELRRREPGQEQRVHRRAADWYEQRDMAEQVIMHRIAGADTVGAARAVNLYGREFVAAGRIATVRGWIDELGTEAVLAYPPMAVTAAWVSALSGRAERAHHFLLAADRASFPGPLPDGHTSLESAIAVLRGAMGSLGIDRMLLDTRLAYDLEPPGSPWHPLAATMLGVAHLLSGSPEEATKLFERGALLGVEQARPAASLALAQLALLAADDQDWAAAQRNAAQAEEVMAAGNLRDDVASVLTHLAAAKVDVRRGRSQQARQRLGTAVRVYLGVPPTAFPWMAAQAAVVLGEVSLELGDTAAARTRVEDARRHLARLLTEGVLRSRLDALSAAVARAGGRSSAPSAMALSAAEERVLRLLPTHLSLGEIGDELHVSRNTVKSHVGAVYRKLQASTRTEAVTRARELGLLSR